MRPLIELIQAVPEPLEFPPDSAHLPISAIATDSRQVAPGTLFVAVKGEKIDGAQFIAQAKQSGAVAVLCDKDAKIPEGIVAVRSEHPRRALAYMAAALQARQPAHIAAITGTDGKTSTADFFRQFWHLLGEASASVGTLGVLSGAGAMLQAGSHTTPDPVQLHALLADLVDHRVDYLAMEASSHGLDQYRLDGVKLEAAAFTNIARDHLDYHKTEAAYFAAKARLFESVLPAGKTAVLNADDAHFAALSAVCARRGHNVIGFGRGGEQFRLRGVVPVAHGQRAEVELFGARHALDIPLVGEFQVMNILAALGLVVGCGGEIAAALSVIPRLKGVPGRLEQVARLANGAPVFIDYAHTPLALANILATLRPHTHAKLHVVFGCGGERDAGKRPEMGAIAQRLADEIIVTDDNPRGENALLIRRAILKAAPGAKEVADRKQAIYAAIAALGPGDALVIAGKGHERTQIVGDKSYPFDDAAVAREAVKELKLA